DVEHRNGKSNVQGPKWLDDQTELAVSEWANSKTGINAAAAVRAGARACQVFGFQCVGFAAINSGGSECGQSFYRIDGQPFPAIASAKIGERKVHTRGKNGVIICGTRADLESAAQVWLTEGITDLLSVGARLPYGHVAVTMLCGANCSAKQLAALL